MTANPVKNETVSDREIVITRIIDATRERVFDAMTDPKQVVKWWGPYGFSTTIHEMDVRPGGVWKQTMHGPDGKNYANRTVFNEIVRPERITYTHSGGEEDASSPVCFQAEWEFEAEGKNKTKLTIRMVSKTDESHKNATERYHAVEGGHQTLARLGDYMAGDTEPFIISRTFDAPRELVWKAWTEAEHMAKWYRPKDFTALASKMDFRPGGSYHYGMKSPGGEPIWGRIFYRRIKAPELLIYVNCFSDENGGITRHPLSKDPWPLEMLSTITLTEENGKTTLTVKWVPINPTPEEKEAFNKGRQSMTQGWGGTFENFAAYSKEMKGQGSAEEKTEIAKSGAVVLERVYNAPIAKVWKALTVNEEMKQWYFNLKEFRAEAGFEFRFDVEHEGHTYIHLCKVTEVVPGRKIAYSWRYKDQPGDSVVSFELFEQGNQTKLRLVHEGLDTFPKVPAYAKENFVAGWTDIIGNSLKQYVEK